MNRRWLIWGIVALLALLTLASGLATRLERESVPVHEPPQAAARRNPYLALERFTERMGGTLTRRSDASVLDRLPAGGTVLLDRQRAHWLPADRLRNLLAWVEDGGYLLVVAERPGVEDPLLDHFGISRLTKAGDQPAGPPRMLEVDLPQGQAPLRVDAAGPGLRAGSRPPSWSAGRPGAGAQWLHYAIGRGNLTVAVGLDNQLSNRQIGELDHAELYWTLLSRYDHSPKPQVLLLSRLQMPGLFVWLWENAWAACVATACVLALWLWRIMPRFGPCYPEAPPARRELREHLAAVGRYLWRAGALPSLLVPVREHFHTRLTLRHPRIAALPKEERPAALAELSRFSSATITAALESRAINPHAFTDVMRTLDTLGREL
ncbi:MAG TPA: DUF4350 domain-containing protein [Accumulibacter sp.]|nr:DUF4350 domain-containing protein [Accumulibacter sp.]HMX23475.1 DUF4350 domain-containing protein [Accumulibacter sp.]HNC17127.1 DUF4350 domain-containing protein [Accumulibacter sp.]HND79390.1 DUF4350 domain-containing protein [Accumulibacter sp.]HNE12664.1 DUF4350 domain-containing protein [Accumulibacter sp.]